MKVKNLKMEKENPRRTTATPKTPNSRSEIELPYSQLDLPDSETFSLTPSSSHLSLALTNLEEGKCP